MNKDPDKYAVIGSDPQAPEPRTLMLRASTMEQVEKYIKDVKSVLAKNCPDWDAKFEVLIDMTPSKMVTNPREEKS